MSSNGSQKPHFVVLGGNFAGLGSVRAICEYEIEIER